MLEKQLVSVIKPQYVDIIPTKLSGKLADIIAQKDENKKS
jgi:translation initiation factor RLI1